MRLIIPLLYGKHDVVENMKSLDSLSNYVNTHKEEKIFPNMSSEFMPRVFFVLYYDEIINADKTLKEEVFHNYLEMLLDLDGRYEEAYQKQDSSIQIMRWSNRYGGALLNLDEEFGVYQDNLEDPYTRIFQSETLGELCVPLDGVRDVGIAT